MPISRIMGPALQESEPTWGKSQLPIGMVKGKVVRLVFISSKRACPRSISHCRQKTHLKGGCTMNINGDDTVVMFP